MTVPRQKKSRRSSCGQLWAILVFLVCGFGLLLTLYPSQPTVKGRGDQIQVRHNGEDVLDSGRAAGCRSQLSHLEGEKRIYSIVFDIGSTGNRVHAFRFKKRDDTQGDCIAIGCLKVEDELFLEDHNPLSKLDNPKACVEALKPLYEAAMKYVPTNQQSCTLMEIKATAGLRKVGRERANMILSSLRDYYGKGKFWMRGENSCRIMEGKEEGPMAWTTVNFLLGSFNDEKSKTAAIIDLGGGSTQIVFEPLDSQFEDSEHFHSNFKFTQKIGNRVVKAYQHSYEGYGLHEAVQTLLCRLAGTCTSGTFPSGDVQIQREKKEFACFAGGFHDPESGLENTGKGTNFTRCVELFDMVLHPDGHGCPTQNCGIGQVFQPSLSSFKGNIYAFSFIYDLMKDYLPSTSNVITANRIAEVGEEKCKALTFDYLSSISASKMSNSSLYYEYQCMYYAYIYALLTNGYRIPPDRSLNVEKKIDGFETAWALGAGLMSLSEI